MTPLVRESAMRSAASEPRTKAVVRLARTTMFQLSSPWRRRSGRRIQDPSQLGEVFEALGSNLNPILTQLAKTRRALFVEGKDFQILGRFARKLGADAVANRRDFAVVPVEGELDGVLGGIRWAGFGPGEVWLAARRCRFPGTDASR